MIYIRLETPKSEGSKKVDKKQNQEENFLVPRVFRPYDIVFVAV